MKTTVAVIRGGPTNEYSYSIKNGAEIMRHLPDEKYIVRDIFVDTEGTWHARGIPMTPVQALWGNDVVINAIHGGIGEDGTVSRFLKQQGIPFVGSDPLPLSRAYNKSVTRTVLQEAGITVPQGISFFTGTQVDLGSMVGQVFARFGPPYIVKPLFEGRSHGITFAPTIHDLAPALNQMLRTFGSAIVEAYIHGDHIRASVVRDFRNEPVYVFPIAHTRIPKDAPFITSEHYTNDSLIHEVPSRHTPEEKRSLEAIARATHEALELGSLSHVDMIRTPRRTYVLEVDTAPDLLPVSPVVHMMRAVGVTPEQYLDHMIARARTV